LAIKQAAHTPGPCPLLAMTTEMIMADDGIAQVHTITFSQKGLRGVIATLKAKRIVNFGRVVLALDEKKVRQIASQKAAREAK
jgi:hypothetical protein